MIHSTIPGRKEPDIGLRDRARDLIKSLKGKRNAKTSYWIAEYLGLKVSNTNEKIRTVMKELLVEECLPVISCSKGFFLADNADEIREFDQNLDSRIAGLQRDKAALNKILRPRLF
jgi:hypothetical protein